MIEPLKNQQLVREWEQAWSHYRHLESTRSQYVGFFFTVQLAAVGLAVGLAKDVDSNEQTAVTFGLMVLTFVDFLLTIGLFTAIKKLRYVLLRYETVMATVRRESGLGSSQDLPFNLADMKDYPRRVLEGDLFSVQRSAERLLAATSLLLTAILAVLAVHLFVSRVSFALWQVWVGSGIAASAVGYLLAVFVPLLRNAREKKIASNSPNISVV